MKNSTLKKVILLTALFGVSAHVSAYQDDEFTMTAKKWIAATKTVTLGATSALLYGAAAKLSRPTKAQDISAIGKALKGANRGAAVVMFGLGTLCAVPAVTNGFEWMHLKYKLWQINNR